MLKKGDPDGKPVPVTVKDRVKTGDIVRVRFSDTGEGTDSKVAASKGDIRILYEDEDVVVLDKTAGVVSKCRSDRKVLYSLGKWWSL